MAQKPWEVLGIPKSTYYYQQSNSVQSSPTVSPTSSPKQSKVVFDGTNGNICGNITRKELKAVLDAGKTTFVPNWYSAGCESKLGVLTGKG